MDQEKIVEITTIEELIEMSTMAGGAVGGYAQKEDEKTIRRESKMISRKEMIAEMTLRKVIRKKLNKLVNEQKNEENELRSIIKAILSEGDLSDTHPNRSTGINTLEDVLKKSIPTGEASALMAEQTGREESDDEDLLALEQAGVEVEVEDDMKIPVEDDDTPSPEEEFGGGLEGQDETGRNHAYTSYRKISQYILDAYDSLANPKDKQIFLDYLVTNMKLYFDKFEDELQTTIEEPTTPEYDQAKI